MASGSVKGPFVVIKTFTSSYTSNGKAGVSITVKNFKYARPSEDYYAVLRGYTSGNNDMAVMNVRVNNYSDSTTMMHVRGRTTNNYTATASISVAFIHKDVYSTYSDTAFSLISGLSYNDYSFKGLSNADGSDTKTITKSNIGYTLTSNWTTLGVSRISSTSSAYDWSGFGLKSENDTAVLNIVNDGMYNWTTETHTIYLNFFNVLKRFVSTTLPVNGSNGNRITMPLFYSHLFSFSTGSVAAGEGKSFSKSTISYTVPDGYTFMCPYRVYGGNAQLTIQYFTPGNNNILRVYNAANSAKSGTANIGAIFVNNNLIEPSS